MVELVRPSECSDSVERRPLIGTLYGCGAAAMAAMPGTALAHAETGWTSGFAQGFIHPLTGADHVLTMVAVGLLGAMLGRRALWLAPLGFLLGMQAGAMLGLRGLALPGVEAVIWASVIAMGALLVLQRRVPSTAAVVAVVSFGVFHGHAHGVAAPLEGALGFGAGFMIATALLHGAGIAVGLAAVQAARRRNARSVVVTGGAAADLGKRLCDPRSQAP